MTVYAPPKPGSVTFAPVIVENTGTLSPFLGGVDQRIQRLGDRWGCNFATPPLSSESARQWIAFILAAKSQEAAIRWLEVDAPKTNYGDPRVDEGGQTGTTLAIRELPQLARIEAGKFFSILDSGRRSLHTVLERVDANTSGEVTVSIWPRLRFSPTDGAVIELAKPYIQGFIRPSESPWTVNMAVNAGVSFQLVEAR